MLFCVWHIFTDSSCRWRSMLCTTLNKFYLYLNGFPISLVLMEMPLCASIASCWLKSHLLSQSKHFLEETSLLWINNALLCLKTRVNWCLWRQQSVKDFEKDPAESYPGTEAQCIYINVWECNCKSVSWTSVRQSNVQQLDWHCATSRCF